MSLRLDIPNEPGIPLHTQIERELRRQIATGKLVPGQRLPPATELAEQFGVHFLTVHKALSRLKAAGLISRTPRLGTFVRTPTDRLVLGVMFGPSLADETGHFYRAVLRGFQEQMEQRGWLCRAYDGLNTADPSEPVPSHPAFRQFQEDALSQRFGGLVAVGLNRACWQRLLSVQDSVGVRYAQTLHDMDVSLDLYDFAYRSVESLVHRGRKRLLYLRTFHPAEGRTEDADGFFDAVRKFGVAEFKMQELPLVEKGHFNEAAAHAKGLELVRTLRANGAAPDGVILSDDVATRGFALALCSRGVAVPGEVAVATLAIEGVDHHYGIPVEKYQFSPREIVVQVLDLLRRRIEGTDPGPLPRRVRGTLLSYSPPALMP